MLPSGRKDDTGDRAHIRKRHVHSSTGFIFVATTAASQHNCCETRYKLHALYSKQVSSRTIAGFAMQAYLDSSGGMIETAVPLVTRYSQSITKGRHTYSQGVLSETKFGTDYSSLSTMGGSWRLIFALLVASIAGSS